MLFFGHVQVSQEADEDGGQGMVQREPVLQVGADVAYEFSVVFCHRSSPAAGRLSVTNKQGVVRFRRKQLSKIVTKRSSSAEPHRVALQLERSGKCVCEGASGVPWRIASAVRMLRCDWNISVASR